MTRLAMDPKRGASPKKTAPYRRALSLVFLSVMATASASAWERPPSSLDYTPELDHGLLGKGRQAYRQRRDDQRAIDAYQYFGQNLEQNPNDPVAAWHYSLSCYYMGMRVVLDTEGRKKLFADGRAVANRGVENDERCGPCHLLAAINAALWAREVGIFRVLVGLPNVKRHLQRAAELDPAFGGGAAYRTQALIAKRLPRLFGGGKKKARKYLMMAIEISPEEHLNYEFLAELLLEEFDDPRAAVAVARQGLLVPAPGPEYVESLDSLEEIRLLVDRYGG